MLLAVVGGWQPCRMEAEFVESSELLGAHRRNQCEHNHSAWGTDYSDEPLLHTVLDSKKLFKKDRCVAVLFQYNVKLLLKTIIHPLSDSI